MGAWSTPGRPLGRHAGSLQRRLDGLGHAEIAQRLGVSVPRVRQYLAQGIRQCYIALYGEPS